MKVFISWSGDRSRRVAEALRDWIPSVIQSAKPWMSKRDIGAGARWPTEIATQLADTDFGILCVTADNPEAPWLVFEAGALSKSLAEARVCPYLIGVEPAEIPAGPLSLFQAKRASKSETLELLQSINAVSGAGGLDDAQLRRSFDRFWPDLEKDLKALPAVAPATPPTRPVHDMVAELLELVRGLGRQGFTVPGVNFGGIPAVGFGGVPSYASNVAFTGTPARFGDLSGVTFTNLIANNGPDVTRAGQAGLKTLRDRGVEVTSFSVSSQSAHIRGSYRGQDLSSNLIRVGTVDSDDASVVESAISNIMAGAAAIDEGRAPKDKKATKPKTPESK